MHAFTAKSPQAAAPEPAAETPTRPRRHASRPPVWAQAASGPLLSGWRVSEPGDALEREAERRAEVVLRAPGGTVQRACNCPFDDEDGLVQRQAAGETDAVQAPARLIPGGGAPLPEPERRFFESRFGADFGGVRIHTGLPAEDTAQALNARAYTLGQDIVFARGQYAPGTRAGRRLLAHELTHVLQQRRGAASSTVQRAVTYNVLDWSAQKLGPPTPTNGADPRTILIPATGQIQVSALVEVNGDAADACDQHEIGTTQTAWVAWTIMDYRGTTPADGSITVRHNAAMPMRDPGPNGAVWYDAANVRSPAACGDSVGIFHTDSPWHNPPKARNNSAVAGNPLNFLVRYRRGLHLVTYLTARDDQGNFLARPLRFRYWNSIQNFGFTPQPPAPPANAAFLGMWPYTGGITVNIGGAGQGETADAPYYTTAGANYNDHFNTFANWTVTERTTW